MYSIVTGPVVAAGARGDRAWCGRDGAGSTSRLKFELVTSGGSSWLGRTMGREGGDAVYSIKGTMYNECALTDTVARSTLSGRKRCSYDYLSPSTV